MSFDGITTNTIVHELNKVLCGSRVEKIYVPNKNEIIVACHTQERENAKLLISIDANASRIHLTKSVRENPTKAPQFCMILRKYMQGGKILSIVQKDLDRVIHITFENINDFGDYVQRTLVIELMGKYSNAILLSDGTIIDSMRHVTNVMSSVREVLPGKIYIEPSSLGKYNFLETNFDNFAKILDKNNTIANEISSKFVGISKSFISGICANLNLDADIAILQLTNAQLKEVFDKIKYILNSIQNNQVTICWKENNKDYFIADSSSNNKLLSYSLDEFYIKKDQVSILKNAKLNLEHEVNSNINKIQKKLNQSLEILKDEDNLEMYKTYGDLISSNIYRMQIGMEKLTTENFYDNNTVVEIPLQKNRTPSQNAQLYYKKYAKLKKSISYAYENKNAYEKDITYLSSVLFNLEEAQELKEVDEIREELETSEIIKKPGKRNKKRDLPLEPIHYEKDGIEILVGRNNIQNDRLTFKIAKKSDTWLHTKNIHGSHVIVRSDNIPDDVLLYAAQIAAKHSQAKDTSRVEVDYTLVKYVHKEAGSKPGMVVYTDYHTIIV